MNILGILGKSKAGKDTAADILVAERMYTKVALADPIKRAGQAWFGWSNETLWGRSELRNIPDEKGRVPRDFLKITGTEVGRLFYRDTWVEICLRTTELLLKGDGLWGYDYTPAKGLMKVDYGVSEGVVVPDVRFRNEVDAIIAAGGKVWKITRPGTETGTHASETEQDGIPNVLFDRIIANDGTLDDLRRAVLAAREL